MDHLNYLSDVSCADVAHVMEKEKTYGGSWKKRLGVGAYMMLARKIDRLEIIVERAGYDVFKVIEDQKGGGEDGTALAEIRDLRRYLLLIESEMVARGVVQLDNKQHHAAEQVLAPSTRRYVICSVEESRPATPEDGGQHAKLEPWVVDTAWLARHEISLPVADVFYRRIAPSVCALEPHLPRDACVDAFYPFVRCYRWEHACDAWVVRIDECPPEARDHFPRLADGINAHELRQVDEAMRGLYDWSESEGKHNLRDKAWSRDAA